MPRVDVRLLDRLVHSCLPRVSEIEGEEPSVCWARVDIAEMTETMESLRGDVYQEKKMTGSLAR